MNGCKGKACHEKLAAGIITQQYQSLHFFQALFSTSLSQPALYNVMVAPVQNLNLQ
jgi:hypothetical protein